MSAIYPAVGESITLRRVTDASGNTLTEPQVYTIAAGGYSESVGFGNTPIDLAIRIEGTLSNSSDVELETSDTPTFTVAHKEADIELKHLTAGSTVLSKDIEGDGLYFRIKNTSPVAVTVIMTRKPWN